MDKKAFSVGVFVFLLIIGGCILIGWFKAPKQHDEYIQYIIYFDIPVTGLSVGSPVRLKGIDVGLVDGIEFASFHSDQVKVTAKIINTAPILEDTMAQLKMQGLTGLSYLYLENTQLNSPALTLKPGQDNMEIKASHLRFDSIYEDLPVLLKEFKEMTKIINYRLEQNQSIELKANENDAQG